MKIKVLFFGQLTDFTKCTSIDLEGLGTTDEIKEIIFERFPELAFAKFVLAMNNEIVLENTVINDNCILAFMSPFSGG
jgi:molybdopterin converting factor small subunit